MPILTCPECNSQFEPRKAWQKYCSQDCNQSAYLKRKLDKKRKNPLQVLDLDLDLGPSPAQEAEWQRRTEVAEAETIRKEEEALRDLEQKHINLDVRLGIEERNKQGRTILDGYVDTPKKDN